MKSELGCFDAALSDAPRIHVHPRVLRLFAIVTRLGDVGFLVAVGALVAITLAGYASAARPGSPCGIAGIEASRWRRHVSAG